MKSLPHRYTICFDHVIQINKQEHQTLIAKHKNISTFNLINIEGGRKQSVFEFKSHIIIIHLSFSSINGNLYLTTFGLTLRTRAMCEN